MATLDDYLKHRWDQEGQYRAFPIRWRLEEKQSGAAAIVFEFALKQQWHGDEVGWSQEWGPGYYSEGRAWIVKKDGAMNEGAIENLAKCGLWNGDFDALEGRPPQVMVIVDVRAEAYEGKTYYRVAWINPNADVPEAPPGGWQPTNPDTLATLRKRFQTQTRAIAGGKAGGQGGNQAGMRPPAPGVPSPGVPAPQPTPAPVPTPVPSPVQHGQPGSIPSTPPSPPQVPPNTPQQVPQPPAPPGAPQGSPGALTPPPPPGPGPGPVQQQAPAQGQPGPPAQFPPQPPPASGPTHYPAPPVPPAGAVPPPPGAPPSPGAPAPSPPVSSDINDPIDPDEAPF